MGGREGFFGHPILQPINQLSQSSSSLYYTIPTGMISIRNLLQYFGLLAFRKWGGFGNRKYNQLISHHSTPMQALDIPNCFESKQKMLTFGLDMHLKADGDTFGKVVQKLGFGEKYELQDRHGNVVARAKEMILKFGTNYEIVDAQGHIIGYFDHEIMKSLMSLKSKYVIMDQHKVPRLYTEEMDFFGTDVKIYDGHKNLICEMKKPVFSLKSKFQVNICGPVDRRIIAMIPTFLAAIHKRKHD